MFGNRNKNGNKYAEAAAAAATELERLCALSPAALAAELMPAFAPGSGARMKGRMGIPAMQMIQWLMASYPHGPGLRPLVDRVPVSLKVLENAGLVLGRTPSTGSGVSYYSLTPRGQESLADGSFVVDLGLPAS